MVVTLFFLTFVHKGTSRGVGFVRFDRRQQAEAAINALHNTIPPGGTEPLVVKFASNPSQHYQKALQQFYMTGQLPMQISPTRRNNIYNTVGPGPVRHITPCVRYLCPSCMAHCFMFSLLLYECFFLYVSNRSIS